MYVKIAVMQIMVRRFRKSDAFCFLMAIRPSAHTLINAGLADVTLTRLTDSLIHILALARAWADRSAQWTEGNRWTDANLPF
jgi:hypothetical protein